MRTFGWRGATQRDRMTASQRLIGEEARGRVKMHRRGPGCVGSVQARPDRVLWHGKSPDLWTDRRSAGHAECWRTWRPPTNADVSGGGEAALLLECASSSRALAGSSPSRGRATAEPSVWRVPRLLSCPPPSWSCPSCSCSSLRLSAGVCVVWFSRLRFSSLVLPRAVLPPPPVPEGFKERVGKARWAGSAKRDLLRALLGVVS